MHNNYDARRVDKGIKRLTRLAIKTKTFTAVVGGRGVTACDVALDLRYKMEGAGESNERIIDGMVTCPPPPCFIPLEHIHTEKKLLNLNTEE